MGGSTSKPQDDAIAAEDVFGARLIAAYEEGKSDGTTEALALSDSQRYEDAVNLVTGCVLAMLLQYVYFASRLAKMVEAKAALETQVSDINAIKQSAAETAAALEAQHARATELSAAVEAQRVELATQRDELLRVGAARAAAVRRASHLQRTAKKLKAARAAALTKAKVAGLQASRTKMAAAFVGAYAVGVSFLAAAQAAVPASIPAAGAP